MEWWKLLYWLPLPILLIGFIVLCFTLPAVAVRIIDVILKLFQLVLGYRIGVALVTAIAVGLAVNYWRHSKDDKAFAAERAAFEQAQQQRDADIAAKTRAEVYQQLQADAADDAETDKEVKDFSNALPVPHTDDMPQPVVPAGGKPAPPVNPWLVGDDACRLRYIAGARKTRCGSGSPQGVPEARRPAKGTRHHS